MQRYDAVLFDVDGTLIDPSEALTPAFDELHDLIKRNGLRFTLASGRSTDQLRKYLDKLEIIEPVIINNGGGARQNGAPLWDELLDPLCIKRAVLEADKLDMAIFMCDGDHETAYRHNAISSGRLTCLAVITIFIFLWNQSGKLCS